MNLLCRLFGHKPQVELECIQTLYDCDVRDAYYCKRCGEDVTYEVLTAFRKSTAKKLEALAE